MSDGLSVEDVEGAKVYHSTMKRLAWVSASIGNEFELADQEACA